MGGVEGDRSFGPARGLLVGGADYPQHANAQMLALAMIETRAGLEAVEAIAAVAQLDGLFIGPSALGIELGLGPGAAHDHAVLAAAIHRIQVAANAAGKVTGIWCGNAEMARAMHDSATHPTEPHWRTLAALLLLAGMSPQRLLALPAHPIAAHSGASNCGF